MKKKKLWGLPPRIRCAKDRFLYSADMGSPVAFVVLYDRLSALLCQLRIEENTSVAKQRHGSRHYIVSYPCYVGKCRITNSGISVSVDLGSLYNPRGKQPITVQIDDKSTKY